MINVGQPAPGLRQQAEQGGVDWEAFVADLDRADNAIRGGAIFTRRLNCQCRPEVPDFDRVTISSKRGSARHAYR